MFVAVRLRSEASLTDQLQRLVDAFGERPGFVGGEFGPNVDAPDLWCAVLRWQDVGSYRRALSSYDVKMAFLPLQHLILDEPTAYAP